MGFSRRAIGQIVGAWALIASVAAIAQDAKPIAEAPVFKVGDSWKIQTHDIGNKREPTWYTNTVASVDDKQYVFAGELKEGSKFWWVGDTKANKLLARFDYDEAAPDKRGKRTRDTSANDPFVQFPLQVGRKYAIKEKWVNSSGDNGDNDLKAEVVAYETIKVPAGEFDVFKIEVEGWWNNRRWTTSGKLTSTLWYSPVAKRPVKSEFKDFNRGIVWNHRTDELIEFKPGQ